MRLHRLLPALLLAASTYAHAAPKPGCQYFTQQDAATLISEPVKPGMDFGMSLCNFSSAAGSLTVQAGIRPGMDGTNPVSVIDDLARTAGVAHYAAIPVPGLGDKAVLIIDSIGNLTLDVAVKGNMVMVSVRGSKNIDSPARRDAMVKAAKVVISRL